MPFFAQMHRVAIKIQILCDDARIHKFLSRIVIVDLVPAQEAVDHSLRQKVRRHHGPYLSLVGHHEDLKGNSSSGKLLSDLLERAQRPILVRHDSLTAARVLYKAVVLNYAERLIMLCDKARVLARSDRPETMPEIRAATVSRSR